jgi:hypothetical protein
MTCSQLAVFKEKESIETSIMDAAAYSPNGTKQDDASLPERFGTSVPFRGRPLYCHDRKIAARSGSYDRRKAQTRLV